MTAYGGTPRAATPAAASRPRRITESSQPPAPSGRAATSSSIAAQRAHPLHACTRAHHGGDAVAHDGGLLEALRRGQRGQLGAERLDERADVARPGGRDEIDERGVLGRRRAALARRRAPSDAGERTRGPHRAAQREPIAALPQRNRVVDRVAHRLGLALRAQRAEVAASRRRASPARSTAAGRPRPSA